MSDRKSLLQKLSSYGSLAACFIAQKAVAQMVYTDVSPDYSVPSDYTGFAAKGYGYYDLDLNNDGVVDFRIQKEASFQHCHTYQTRYGSHSSVSCYTSGNIGIKAFNGGILVDSSSYFDIILKDSINENGNWVESATKEWGGKDHFIGLRLKDNSGYHYGWVRLNLDGGGNYFVVKDYAYDATPNEGIVAGQGYACDDLHASIFTNQSCVTGYNIYPILQAVPLNENSYTWIGNDFRTLNLPSTISTYGSGTFRVVVTDTFGCRDTSAIVNVSDLNYITAPVITVTGNELQSSPSKYYQWFKGDQPIYGATNQAHAPPEAGNYGVEITDSRGCSAYSSINYTDCSDYRAQIAALNNGPPCAGNGFVIATDAPAATYEWQVNGVDLELNNYYGPGQPNYILPPAEGNYRLIAISDQGCKDTSNTVSIVFNNPTPIPFIVLRADTLFTTGADSYQWSFDGKEIAGAVNSFLVPPENGFYSVEITDSIYCPRSSLQFIYESCAGLHSAISADGPCVNSYLRPANYDNWEIPGYSYQWLENGLPADQGKGAYFFTQEEGNYQLVEGLNNSCFDTSAAYKVYNSSDPVISQIGDTLFSDYATGNKWYVDSGLIHAVKSTDRWFLPSENTNLELEVTDSGGCTYSTYYTYFKCDLTTIEANPGQLDLKPCGYFPGIYLQIDGNFYKPDSVHFHWQENGIAVPGDTGIYYTATAPGVYNVLVTTSGGCSFVTNSVDLTALYPAMLSPEITESGNELQSTSFSDYQWFLNDDTIPGATAQTYFPTQNGSYEVKVTDSNGCKWNSNLFDYYSCSAVASIIYNSDKDTLCSNSFITLFGNYGPAYTYQWQLNSVNIPSANQLVWTPQLSGSYRLITSIPDCCSDTSNSIIVKINRAPTPPGIYQLGDTLISNSLSGNTWYSQYGTEPLSHEQKFIPPAETDVLSYYDIFIDSNGCEATSPLFSYRYCDNISYTVQTSNPPSSCAKFNNLVVNPAAASQYQWQKNDTSIAGANEFYYGISESGNYRVIIHYLSCFDTTAEVRIALNHNPDTPVITELHDTLFGPQGYYYLWTDQDHSSLSSERFLHPDLPGYYTLTISDSNGCTNSATAYYFSCAKAILSVSGSTCGHNPYLSASYYDSTQTGYKQSISMASYNWYENGALIKGATNSTFSLSHDGNYFAIATTPEGCVDTSNTYNAHLDQVTTPKITDSNDTLFAASSDSLTWYEGGIVATGSFYVPIQNGTYEVIARDSAGCTAASSLYNFSACKFFDSTLRYDRLATCGAAVSIYLFEPFTSPYVLQWYHDSLPYVKNTTSISATFSGKYYCIATDSKNSTCRSDTVTATILSPAKPDSIFNHQDTLFTKSTGAYQWLFGEQNITGATNSSYIAVADGAYSLVKVDSNGCTAEGNQINYVKCPPIKILNNCDGELCSGSTMQLLASNYTYNPFGHPYYYQWLLNDTVISGVSDYSYLADQTGTYQVVLYDNIGCRDTSNGARITINDLPTPSVIRQHDTLLCSVQSEFYQWFKNSDSIPGANRQYYLPSSSGKYVVAISDSAGCENTSLPYSYIFSGIGSDPKVEISLSPNPNSGEFIVSAMGIANGLWTVQVMDDLGNTIFDENQMVTSSINSLPVHLVSAAPGMYLVKLFSNKDIYTRRIELIR